MNDVNDIKGKIATAVDAISPIVTNASRKTANYNLPLFTSSDKPSWLIDWNNTMTAIDGLLKEVETGGADNKAELDALKTRVDNLETLVQTAQNDISTNATNIASNAENITNLQNSMNTVQNDILETNATVKEHTTDITELKDGASPWKYGVNVVTRRLTLEPGQDMITLPISLYPKDFEKYSGKSGDGVTISLSITCSGELDLKPEGADNFCNIGCYTGYIHLSSDKDGKYSADLSIGKVNRLDIIAVQTATQVFALMPQNEKMAPRYVQLQFYAGVSKLSDHIQLTLYIKRLAELGTNGLSASVAW